jgi:hypothetical protein
MVSKTRLQTSNGLQTQDLHSPWSRMRESKKIEALVEGEAVLVGQSDLSKL